jgi:DNA primase small subunit
VLDAASEAKSKSLFRSYYKVANVEIDNLEKREFGFGNFEKKIMFRHMAFGGGDELHRYLTGSVPAFVSCSPSLYNFPSARPMERKGWIGSELVFDLDSTDLGLPCQEKHGRGWVCSICQDAVKSECIKLIEDFLVPDFGFSKNQIGINFSGNRGYHVHVDSEEIFNLGSDARKEITDYISGEGVSAKMIFPMIENKNAKLYGPKPSDFGWPGKIARSMVSALNSGDESLISLGMSRSEARLMYENRANIIMGITNGNWDRVKINGRERFWSGVTDRMKVRQSDSIDGNVTSSVYHLLRMPNTLHGDTGLLSRKISSVGRLADFDPMLHSVVFKKGEHDIEITRETQPLSIGKIDMERENSGKRLTLPAYAALYLVLKRYAKFVA